MMTHTYKISGMTCNHCKNKIEELLSKVAGVKTVTVDLKKQEASIEMNEHVATDILKASLQDYPKDQLTEVSRAKPPAVAEEAKEKKSWFTTYKPILLIFIYISIASLIAG